MALHTEAAAKEGIDDMDDLAWIPPSVMEAERILSHTPDTGVTCHGEVDKYTIQMTDGSTVSVGALFAQVEWPYLVAEHWGYHFTGPEPESSLVPCDPWQDTPSAPDLHSYEPPFSWDLWEEEQPTSTAACQEDDANSLKGSAKDPDQSLPNVDCEGSAPDVKCEEPVPDVKCEEPVPDVKCEEPVPDVKSTALAPDITWEHSVPDVQCKGSTPDVKGEVPAPDVEHEGKVEGSVTDTWEDLVPDSWEDSVPVVECEASPSDVKCEDPVPDVNSAASASDVKGEDTVPDVKCEGSAQDVKGEGSSPVAQKPPDRLSSWELVSNSSEGEQEGTGAASTSGHTGIIASSKDPDCEGSQIGNGAGMWRPARWFVKHHG